MGQQAVCCKPPGDVLGAEVIKTIDYDNPALAEGVEKGDYDTSLEKKMMEKHEQEKQKLRDNEKKKKEAEERKQKRAEDQRRQQQALKDAKQKERIERLEREDLAAALTVFQGFWVTEENVPIPQKKGKFKLEVLDIADIKDDTLTWAPRMNISETTKVKPAAGGSLVVVWHNGEENLATLEGDPHDPLNRKLRWRDGTVWMHKACHITEVPAIALPKDSAKGSAVHDYDRPGRSPLPSPGR